MWPKPVRNALSNVGGTVMRTSFDHEQEQKLRDALAGHVTAPLPAPEKTDTAG